LAQLSLDAYSDVPVALPPGFTLPDAASLPITLGPGESFANGVFRNANVAALTAETVLDGQETLVIAFRGADDAADRLSALQGINADYPLFASLIAAVDASAANGNYQQVVVTGHSTGGSLAQIYMEAHPDQPGSITYQADTFGSPGAILPPGSDARLTNFVIADDPVMTLGAYRGEIGDALRSSDLLAEAAARQAAAELPGVSEDQVLATLGSLTVNYANRGDIIILPGKNQDISPAANIAGLARLDTDQHAAELYASTVAAAAATPRPEVLVPTAPQDNPDLSFLRTVYNSDERDPQAAEAVLRQLVEDWTQDAGNSIQSGLNDAFTTIRDGLDGLGRDFGLI
jgi:pimeloyl-ACP methyl ester carboxylesterase